ncbi:DUF2500 domain-containing protein [Fictibacillus sp. b24]|uniref:DUF2500 domain-containing protein n=1 Tax=Fictibacillus sp. b24 TaxID=3055863 RepID=UPI0025A2581C|nr:DUF2500 domain-containing protein [Fictibacillus sp. b24]MDM5317528.1 DUF2500 domain-containing protein [Fictibacillus sp. b24]
MGNFEDTDFDHFEEPGFGGSGDWMFDVLPLFGGALFVIVISIFIFVIIKGIGEWSSNNKQPKLAVTAELVTKRTKVSGGANDTSASTWYYATFEVESGDRMEFHVGSQEYGMLVEGDRGILNFQGSRYLGFERNRQSELS